MSIESEIERIEDNISDAYDVMEAAGAEMPATRNSNNLASTIATIPSGTSSDSLRSLTSTQATQLLTDGTYNGEIVTSGEVFTKEDGTFQEFNDDVTYGGDKQLNFTLTAPSLVNNQVAFNFGHGNKGVVFYSKDWNYGEGDGDSCIKGETLTHQNIPSSSLPRYFNDGTKLYRITTNSVYRASTDGTTWGNEVSFASGMDSSHIEKSTFYKALGKVLIFAPKDYWTYQSYSYADSMDSTFTAGTFPAGMEEYADCRVLVFDDEVRLLDLTANKLYSTTDFSQGWTDTGVTPTLPPSLQSGSISCVGGIVYAYSNPYGNEQDNVLYYSTDRGETWSTATIPHGAFTIAYCEDTQTWVAVRPADTTYYYTSIDGHTFTAQTPSTGTTIYGNLLGATDCAYTASTAGSSIIYTGAAHDRSLIPLSYNKTEVNNLISSSLTLTSIAQAGTGIVFGPALDIDNVDANDKIGSPTISNKGLFTPTSTAYLKITGSSVGENVAYPIANGGYNWEFTIKVKTPAAYETGKANNLWEFAPYYHQSPGLSVWIEEDGTVKFNYWKSGSWYNIQGTDALDTNTWYYVRVAHNSSTGLILETSKDGTTWKEEGTSSTTGGFTGQGTSQYFFISIVDSSSPAIQFDLTGLTYKSSYNSINWVAYVDGGDKTEISTTVPTIIVDQVYSGVSTNAQSGVAVKQAVDEAVSSVYKPAGSVAFSGLPTLGASYEGYVYNINEEFTTDANFVEGAGKTYPAGTNVVCIDVGSSTYKWDVLAGYIAPTHLTDLAEAGTGISFTQALTQNFTTQGNPTIINKVASGFSSSNYILPTLPIFTTANSWELGFKITTGSNITDRNQIFQYTSGLTEETRYSLDISLNNSHFGFDTTYNGTAFDIDGNSATGTYTVLTNTTYWIKMGWTGTEYYLSYSLDGTNYTKDISIQSSTATYSGLQYAYIGCWIVAWYSSGNKWQWQGLIDLNECYIKADDNIIWTPYTTSNNKTIINATVSIQKVTVNNTALTTTNNECRWVITHNLGTKDVNVSVYDLTTDMEPLYDVEHTSTNTVTVIFNSSVDISADSYRAVIIG